MQIESLARIAAETAMRAAAEVAPKGADAGRLCAAIRAEVKAALPGALADAREAFEAGMGNVAEATFLASMGLAGIRAARSTERRGA